MADVKPSILNWLVVGLTAVTFIVAAKWLANRYPTSGITELINMV